MSSIPHSVIEILGHSGPLATCLDGFQVRPQQQAMADAIAQSLQTQQDLLVEAGTGTGKTLAYLVPAIVSGKKIIISTGTKNLQDQLLHRDVPLLHKALKLPVSISVLKGRSNYLCLHRLEQAQIEPTFDGNWKSLLGQLSPWAARSKTGDIAEFDAMDENDPLWLRVTSTSDNCLGQECSDYDRCFLVNARRDAQTADIVIVNHHLLFSDMALQDNGFGELLPRADAYIIDEAHQLPEIASQFFGLGLSTNQFSELAQDAETEYRSEINENDSIERCAQAIARAITRVRQLFGAELRRENWSVKRADSSIVAALNELRESTQQLQQHLTVLAERSRTLESCLERCASLLQRLGQITKDIQPEYVYWYEVHRRSVSFHLTPLDIAEPFIAHKTTKQGVWIFTSATLTVANQFTHYTSRMGLQDIQCLRWDSPFDYSRQALLFLPGGMPEPNTPAYNRKVTDIAISILTLSKGRAFLLFTSHRALQEAARVLSAETAYHLFIQGKASRDILLSQFRQTSNAVLLGTSSFWEGVDVRGDALSCVIIDKLPFAAPDDPVLQARIDAMRKQGQNPFMEYQLPSAVITLKQGAGRLIRDIHDRGVLVLCDPRLSNKPYGRIFLQSLPPMPITRSMADVDTFFANTL